MFTLHNVTKTYRGGVVALDDVTVNVDAGEFLYLIGPSGSGKSTFMKLLTREVDADEGTVSVCGVGLTGLSRRKVTRVRRRVGHVFQDVRLLPDQTVARNVAFALKVRGESRSTIAERVPTLLASVGLAEKSSAMPHELSGGQQQRVAIARALATRPQLLLCDEPTGNLDPDTSHRILALLERIHDAGTTVLMATHDDRLVDTHPHRVVELARGVKVRDEHNGSYRR